MIWQGLPSKRLPASHSIRLRKKRVGLGLSTNYVKQSQQYGSQVDQSPIKKGRSNADGSVHLNRLAEFPVLSDDMLVAEENSTFDDEKGGYSDSSSDSDGSDDMFQTNSYQRRKKNQNQIIESIKIKRRN